MTVQTAKQQSGFNLDRGNKKKTGTGEQSERGLTPAALYAVEAVGGAPLETLVAQRHKAKLRKAAFLQFQYSLLAPPPSLPPPPPGNPDVGSRWCDLRFPL